MGKFLILACSLMHLAYAPLTQEELAREVQHLTGTATAAVLSPRTHSKVTGLLRDLHAVLAPELHTTSEPGSESDSIQSFDLVERTVSISQQLTGIQNALRSLLDGNHTTTNQKQAAQLTRLRTKGIEAKSVLHYFVNAKVFTAHLAAMSATGAAQDKSKAKRYMQDALNRLRDRQSAGHHFEFKG